MTGLPSLPRSLSVLRLLAVANFWLTAKAFWSTALVAVSGVTPFCLASGTSAAMVLARSEEATDAALGPLISELSWLA